MTVFGLGDLAFLGAVGGVAYDADAAAYIVAVEAADGQALEAAVKDAIDAFVVGCKSDPSPNPGVSNWQAIKAGCIPAGARTLAGALVPLVGAAPTRFGTEGGWNYNRKTGLQGNGTNNYLNSNRAANADPQDSFHMCVYGSSLDFNTNMYIGSSTSTYKNQLVSLSNTNFFYENRCAAASNQFDSVSVAFPASGFVGTSRSSASLTTARRGGRAFTNTASSVSVSSQSYFVHALNYNGSPSYHSAARFAFYSIGEAVDLALLDARVTTLINALSTAIP